jgi:hypothetical protein
MSENKLQKATNEIVKWIKESGFNMSVEKTKAMLIHRRKPRVYELPKLKARLGPNAIEMVTAQHRILGLIIDDPFEGTPERCEGTIRQKTGDTKDTIAHINWGGDQKTLLRIHQIIVLSRKKDRSEPPQN